MAKRTECGERLWRVLSDEGFVHAGHAQVTQVLKRVNARLGTGREIKRSALDAVLYRGTEVSLPLAVALAEGLRVRLDVLAYDDPPRSRKSGDRNSEVTLQNFNLLMPILDKVPSGRAGKKGDSEQRKAEWREHKRRQKPRDS